MELSNFSGCAILLTFEKLMSRSRPERHARIKMTGQPLSSQPGRRAMVDQEQLKPNDFPVHTEKKKIVKTDGNDIAEAKTTEIAEDIADRLNSEEAQREEDRWA
jgi:hypothetical protein